MRLSAWRIVKAKHAASAFSGIGARLAGGRWNSPGHAVVYTSASASLAMLEMLVHLQSEELLRRYVLFEVTLDDSLVTTVTQTSMPKTWRKSPPPAALQRIGDAWLAAGTSAILRIPSVIVPAECNYLLNPAHSDFARIIIGPKMPAQFDPRLVKRENMNGV
ncbi:MAG: RES family NAD+ phosphorylase [Tepidisphaeraceae bacterium]|jgi:RES domain-containing protein